MDRGGGGGRGGRQTSDHLKIRSKTDDFLSPGCS